MALVPGSSMRDTWQHAILSNEKHFTQKDLVEIKKTTKPDDLLGFIKTLEVKDDKSNISKIARRIGMLGVYFNTYERSLDLIAQGLPSPGCLVWGSIKFALSFIRNYTKIFEKLLEVLESMGIFLQNSGFAMDVVIFQDSPDYRRALTGFYDAFIEFWSRALKFSKQKRRRIMCRAAWSNYYKVEFLALQGKMETHQKTLSQCAEATSRTRAHEARIKEDEERLRHEAARREVRDNTRKATRAEVLKFLALGKASVTEYELVYNKTYRSLHPGTCQWILKSDTFQTWTKAPVKSNESLLWISAVPGAGKSFLYAFLVDHLRSIASADSGPVLFYMFDGRNVENKSSLSAASSLVYQLLNVAQISENLLNALDEYRAQTGQSKATDFEPLWDILSRFIRELSRVTLVLDGLDECEDRVVLLRSILEILRNSNAKIIVLSRREADIIESLDSFPQIRFGKTENYEDILSFLRSKILSSEKLRMISQNRTILGKVDGDLATKLSLRSDGSFLWARTALREIESKAKTSEIIDVITGLPSDLKQSYGFILDGHHKHLDTVRRRIFCMILRWLICAARPLSGKELRAAVAHEYLHLNPAGEANDSVSGSDDEFYIPQAEIEKLGGSLVVTDGGSVQLAHISIVEFLCQGPPNQYGCGNIDDFFVNVPETNGHLTMVCTDYLRTHLGHPPIQRRDRNRQLNLDATNESKGFLLYSTGQWLFHLSQIGATDLGPTRKRLEKFLLGPGVLYWLEMWFAIEGRNLWSLQQQIRTILSQSGSQCALETPEAATILSQSGSQCALETTEAATTALIRRWSKSFSRLLERHGPSLEQVPAKIHFIDPQSYEDDTGEISIFANFKMPDPPIHIPHFRLRSQLLSYDANKSEGASYCHKLNLSCYDSSHLRIFYVDLQRHTLLTTVWCTKHPEIRCQSLKTGQILKPVSPICKSKAGRDFLCEAFTISPDGRFLAILYHSAQWHSRQATESRFDLNVWEIPESLDFDASEKGDWCKIVDAISFEAPSLKRTPQPLIIDESNVLHSPIGPIKIVPPNSSSDTREINATELVRHCCAPEHLLGLVGIAFSADCRFMIAYDSQTSKLNRYVTEGMSLDSTIDIPARYMTICCVSRTGKFVVWAKDLSKEQRNYFLQDFSTGLCTLLPGSEEILIPPDINLTFSTDEKFLLGVMGNLINRDSNYLALWTSLSANIKVARSEIVPSITGLDFTATDNPAYCATNDRWFQFDPLRLDLLHVEYHRHRSSYTRTEVSSQGNKMVVLSVTLQSVDVEMFDLVSREVLRHVILKLPSSRPLTHLPYSVTFSSNLDLLIMDGVLYSLDGNAEYAEPNILPPWPSSFSGGVHAQAEYLPRLKSDISACNKYLIYLYAGDVDLQSHPELCLYRLRPLSGISMTCLHIPRNMETLRTSFAWTAWHPNSPILCAITCELHDKPSSIELHLVISCYTLDISTTTSQWLKAEEIFSDNFSGPLAFKTRIFNLSACFSLCGTYISLHDQKCKRIYGPWTVPIEHRGPVAPYKLPRTIHPNRVIGSMLWGDQTIWLRSSNADGRFEVMIADPEVSIYFFEELLPSYLAAITPVVILDNEQCPQIRLVFPCSDQPPSIMILQETWESLWTAWQKIIEGLEIKSVDRSGHFQCHTDSNMPGNFYEMLTYHKSYRNTLSAKEGSIEHNN